MADEASAVEILDLHWWRQRQIRSSRTHDLLRRDFRKVEDVVQHLTLLADNFVAAPRNFDSPFEIVSIEMRLANDMRPQMSVICLARAICIACESAPD